MAGIGSWKWYAGASVAALAPLVPGVGDPTALSATRASGQFGVGARVLYPFGLALGAIQTGALLYNYRRPIYRESGYMGARTLETFTGGAYQAPAAAWERTPKDRISERHTHGYFVNPRDRMVRNPPMISSRDLADRGYRT